MTAPNRGGRPPKPDGNHAYIGFKTTRQLKAQFEDAYPEGERSKPFQDFLAWLMREPGAKLPQRPPRQEQTPNSERAA